MNKPGKHNALQVVANICTLWSENFADATWPRSSGGRSRPGEAKWQAQDGDSGKNVNSIFNWLIEKVVTGEARGAEVWLCISGRHQALKFSLDLFALQIILLAFFHFHIQKYWRVSSEKDDILYLVFREKLENRGLYCQWKNRSQRANYIPQ